MVVDPTRHPQPYLDLVAEHDMTIAHVIDTHVHADHISGGPALAARLGAEYQLASRGRWRHRALPRTVHCGTAMCSTSARQSCAP